MSDLDLDPPSHPPCPLSPVVQVPVTRKPEGIRMGKGKGAIAFYATPVSEKSDKERELAPLRYVASPSILPTSLYSFLPHADSSLPPSS